MVEDPQGRGHIIRRNTRMGRQGGRVSQILRDAIIVTETWTDPKGKITSNAVTVRVREEKNVKPAVDLLSGKLYD
jgi:type IV pilus assembly protein PilP